MAALTVLKPNTGTGGAEDDEAWLYGDSENGENKESEPAPPGTGQPATAEGGGEGEGEDTAQTQEKYDDDSDDDDDDDVQVTIGDIKAFPINNTGTGLYKPPGTYQKQPVVSVGQKITTTTPGVKGVDVDAEGTINGVGVYEFSLDSLQEEEKPWRKPGADITDYFNYGFNEDTWRKYCQKQNRLRGENGAVVPRTFTMGNSNTVIKMESAQTGYMNQPRVLQPKPIQNIVQTGTIAVLGSTTASRRPADEQTNQDQLGQVPDEMNKSIPLQGIPPPGMNMPPPNYSVPPPGMPQGMPPMPHAFPQAVPPPRMPLPPPGMFSQPPPVPFYPQHVPVVNQPNYGERPPFSYESAPQYPGYPTYTADSKPKYDSREDDRYSRSRSERDRESSSTRDYDRGDYYSRSRDSDRSRSDRDRSRSRDRDRKHRDRDRERDRDEKKSKSRKVKDEPDDSDYYKSSSSSSKHKKSKRSKRDKDDDRPTSDDGDK